MRNHILILLASFVMIKLDAVIPPDPSARSSTDCAIEITRPEHFLPRPDHILVTVNGISGPICSFQAQSHWSIGQVKWKIQQECNKPSYLQKIIFGTIERRDDVTLGSLLSPDSRDLALTLVMYEASNISIGKLLEETVEILSRNIDGTDDRGHQYLIHGLSVCKIITIISTIRVMTQIKESVLSGDAQIPLVVILCNALKDSVQAQDDNYEQKLQNLLRAQGLNRYNGTKEMRGFNIKIVSERDRERGEDHLIIERGGEKVFCVSVFFNTGSANAMRFKDKFLWFLSEKNHVIMDVLEDNYKE